MVNRIICIFDWSNHNRNRLQKKTKTMKKEAMTKQADQYKGVRVVRCRRTSKYKYRSTISVAGKTTYLGEYDDPRQAAKAYDMYIIKHQINRRTNFLKKKNANNE